MLNCQFIHNNMNYYSYDMYLNIFYPVKILTKCKYIIYLK